MSIADYHFITHWRVRAAPDEVTDILSDASDLPRWWPAVYLDVHEIEHGEESGLGRKINLYTKGWLPYTLRWAFTVTDVQRDSITIEARGDFVGRGIWIFAQDGPYTLITYDWKIRAAKPLLRYFSLLFKPIFAANHRWAMAKGEESLNLELRRRRARTLAERAQVPAPPQPTTTSSLPLLGSLAAAVASIYLLMRWLARR